MRRLEFTLSGLTRADPRRRLRNPRARAALVLAVLATLIALGVERRDGIVPEPPPAEAAEDLGMEEPADSQPADEGQSDDAAPRADDPDPVIPPGDPSDAEAIGEDAADNTSTASNQASVPNEEQNQKQPQLTSEPATLLFKDYMPGSLFERVSTQLASTGEAVTLARIALIEGSDAFVPATPSCVGFSIESKPCTQAIEFRPNASGAHSGRFELYDGSNRKLGEFRVQGRAIASAIAVSPDDIDFTSDPRQRQVTVRSAGEAPLQLTDVRIQGSSAFVSSGGACKYRNLRNGEECAFPVSFSARDAGDAELVEAELVIEHNAGVTKVPLRRTQPLLPSLVVDSNPLNFGPVNLGQSATVQVTILNKGNAAAPAVRVSLQRDQSPFTLGGNCNAPVEPKASCIIDVTFKPPAEGAFKNRLIFPDASPLWLDVEGTGVRSQIN